MKPNQEYLTAPSQDGIEAFWTAIETNDKRRATRILDEATPRGILALLKSRKEGTTPLLYASLQNNFGLVYICLGFFLHSPDLKPEDKKTVVNASTDKNNYTLLLLAGASGHTNTVNTLIAAGAKIDAEDDNKRTALWMTARSGHTTTLKALIQHKADIHHRSKLGRTPLFVAAEEGHVDTIEALITAGAEPNKTGPDGHIPLFARQLKTVIFLLLML